MSGAPEPGLDAAYWEGHYRDREGQPRPEPSRWLVEGAAGLEPGTALDAACGEGADAIWLASHGWSVTAVDLNVTALDRARQAAIEAGVDLAARITWVNADLTRWVADRRFDLVTSQYAHPTEPAGSMVRRLAEAVAPGGTLLVVGHDPSDPHVHAHVPEAVQAITFTVSDVTDALDPQAWTVEVAETRIRRTRHGEDEVELRDTVVRARRRA